MPGAMREPMWLIQNVIVVARMFRRQKVQSNLKFPICGENSFKQLFSNMPLGWNENLACLALPEFVFKAQVTGCLGKINFPSFISMAFCSNSLFTLIFAIHFALFTLMMVLTAL